MQSHEEASQKKPISCKPSSQYVWLKWKWLGQHSYPFLRSFALYCKIDWPLIQISITSEHNFSDEKSVWHQNSTLCAEHMTSGCVPFKVQTQVLWKERGELVRTQTVAQPIWGYERFAILSLVPSWCWVFAELMRRVACFLWINKTSKEERMCCKKTQSLHKIDQLIQQERGSYVFHIILVEFLN